MRRLITVSLLLAAASVGAADARAPVDLPPMMQQHMLANMRDHLEALDTILAELGAGRYDAAAATAEQRLGMSSLDAHGARHLAGHMPAAMQALGTAMHRAASRFARTAQEGDLAAATRALGEVSAACVACHRAYRLR